jgi:hypothetical protein
MLYWPLMFLFVALTTGLLAIAFTAAAARKILPDSATYIPPWVETFASESSGGHL